MTEAREAFDKAMSRGHSAAWDQQWEQAVGAYVEALKLVPDEPNVLANMGFALLQLDRLPEALRW
jgi:Flp pilus assembly protein TadD